MMRPHLFANSISDHCVIHLLQHCTTQRPHRAQHNQARAMSTVRRRRTRAMSKQWFTSQGAFDDVAAFGIQHQIPIRTRERAPHIRQMQHREQELDERASVDKGMVPGLFERRFEAGQVALLRRCATRTTSVSARMRKRTHGHEGTQTAQTEIRNWNSPDLSSLTTCSSRRSCCSNWVTSGPCAQAHTQHREQRADQLRPNITRASQQSKRSTYRCDAGAIGLFQRLLQLLQCTGSQAENTLRTPRRDSCWATNHLPARFR